MIASGRSSRSMGHWVTGILAVSLIVFHFWSFGEMYGELLSEGLTLRGLGNGRTLLANLVLLAAVFGSLACLVLAACRSLIGRPGTHIGLSVVLILVGQFAPWAGIMMAWFIGGDA